MSPGKIRTWQAYEVLQFPLLIFLNVKDQKYTSWVVLKLASLSTRGVFILLVS